MKLGMENLPSSEPKGASGCSSSSTSSNQQEPEAMIKGIRDEEEINKFVSTEEETDTTIKLDVGSRSEVSAELLGAEKEITCRICHLGSEQQLSRTTSLIQLGCGCKDELGISHPHCAETWFRSKGNR